jgi:hypothetical protein
MAIDSTKKMFKETLEASGGNINYVPTSDKDDDIEEKIEDEENNDDTEVSYENTSDWTVGTFNESVQEFLDTFKK